MEELDISGNAITTLPDDLGRLGALTVLTLDAAAMIYPSREVCGKGAAAILEHLRRNLATESEDSGCLSGTETDAVPGSSADAETVKRYVKEDERMRDAIKRYNNDEDLKRNDMRRFHAAMDEDHLRYAASIYKGKKSEQKVRCKLITLITLINQF